jgi:hypothetical protein
MFALLLPMSYSKLSIKATLFHTLYLRLKKRSAHETMLYCKRSVTALYATYLA